MALSDVFTTPDINEINDYLAERARAGLRYAGEVAGPLAESFPNPTGIPTSGIARALRAGGEAIGAAAEPYVQTAEAFGQALRRPPAAPPRDVGRLPYSPNAPRPGAEEPLLPRIERNYRNLLAGAPEGFIDERVEPPLDPRGPRKVESGPTPMQTRALRLPNGKILLTNLESPDGAEAVRGRELYEAARARQAEVPSAPAASDWRAGTNFETPATLSLGRRRFLPDAEFTADQVEGRPGGGTFTGSGGPLGEHSVADNPDTRLRLGLEDADRQIASFRAKAALEGARSQAALAGDPERAAQLEAARKAPELIGFDAVAQLYRDLDLKKRAFAEWQRRAAVEGDPYFVEPNQRQLAARMKMQELGLDDAEERIKTLASVVAKERVPYNQYAALASP